MKKLPIIHFFLLLLFLFLGCHQADIKKDVASSIFKKNEIHLLIENKNYKEASTKLDGLIAHKKDKKEVLSTEEMMLCKELGNKYISVSTIYDERKALGYLEEVPFLMLSGKTLHLIGMMYLHQNNKEGAKTYIFHAINRGYEKSKGVWSRYELYKY